MNVLTTKRFVGAVAITILPAVANSFSIESHNALGSGRSRLALALPLEPPKHTLLYYPPNDRAILSKGRQGTMLQVFNVLNHFECPKCDVLWLKLRSWIARRIKLFHRTASILCMALVVIFASASAAAAIPSGGRMGGSFRPSPSISAPSRRGVHGSFGDGPLPPTGLYMRANANNEVGELSGVLVQQPASPSGKEIKVVDPVTYYCALTGVYGLGVYRMKSRGKGKEEGSALGTGASVLSVSVAMDVCNRDDKSNILSRLKEISAGAQTSSRSGLKELISEVALEILRQRDSITSACSTHAHCSGPTHADIEFKRMSTFERAKFGKETVDIFNGVAKVIEPSEVDESTVDENSLATSAVVTLLVSIEGDRTKVPKIVSRRDLENALMRIAADSQVDDCLLSAEVLWSPEDRKITLSNQDITASYPELAVL